MEKFFAKLENSLADNSIIKMTLSKPVSKIMICETST